MPSDTLKEPSNLTRLEHWIARAIYIACAARIGYDVLFPIGTEPLQLFGAG